MYGIHGRLTTQMVPQFASGLLSGLVYGAYFYALKRGRISGQTLTYPKLRTVMFLFTIPVIINSLSKAATNYFEDYPKNIFQYYESHAKRGCITGIYASTIFLLFLRSRK